MATRPVAAAIVLAGGNSSRMGADKASLVVDGETMLGRVLGLLEHARITTIAIAGSDEVPDPVATQPDAAGGKQGPMAGIVAGWHHLREIAGSGSVGIDPVVVLSCDLPSLTTKVITELVASAVLHRHGAVAHDGERSQPLIAAYRPVALDTIEQAFWNGERSVRRCFDGWDLTHVRFDRTVLTDADTPGDLEGFTVDWPE